MNRVVIFESVLLGVAAEAVAPLVDDALEAGVSSAERLVPIDTGNLQDHLDIAEPAHREGDAVVGSYGVVDADSADYWDDVEFGTVKSPAQPYLRPSLDALGQVIR